MPSNLETLIENLAKLPAENEYVEFKENFAEPEREGRDISALANSAAYHDARFAYKVWGVHDGTHKIVGTAFRPHKEKVGNAPLVMWLKQNLSDNAGFEFEEGSHRDKDIVVLRIWPALHHPVEFQHQAYLRKGSHTHKVKSGSLDENELWSHIQKQDFEGQTAAEGLSPEQALELLDANRYFDLTGIPRPSSPDEVLHYLATEKLLATEDDGTVTITMWEPCSLPRTSTTSPPSSGRKFASRNTKAKGDRRHAASESSKRGTRWNWMPSTTIWKACWNCPT